MDIVKVKAFKCVPEFWFDAVSPAVGPTFQFYDIGLAPHIKSDITVVLGPRALPESIDPDGGSAPPFHALLDKRSGVFLRQFDVAGVLSGAIENALNKLLRQLVGWIAEHTIFNIFRHGVLSIPPLVSDRRRFRHRFPGLAQDPLQVLAGV